MNHAGRALLVGMVLAAAVPAACSTRSQSPLAESSASTGQVGLMLTLPGGAGIAKVHVVIAGPTPKTFDQDVSTALGVVQPDGTVAINLGTVAGLTPGAYTVTISATSADGSVVCTGAGAPFVVTANATATVTAFASCRTAAPDAGGVTIGGGFSNCGRVTSIADNIGETTVADTITINGASTGPNPGALTWSFAAVPADGTFVPMTGTGGSPTTTFTCTTPGTVTITLTVADGTLPAGAPPCSDVDTKSLVVVCDAPATGSTSGPTAAANAHCAFDNAGGPCSPTELLFVAYDTDPATGVPKGSGPAFGCYDCLVAGGCIDDKLFASDHNFECGDVGPQAISQPTLSGDAPTTSCLNVISCVLGANCQSSLGDGACYCGTAVGQQCNVAPNGPCLTEEQDGLDATNPMTNNSRFINPAYPAGMANAIFACAASNSCTRCLPPSSSSGGSSSSSSGSSSGSSGSSSGGSSSSSSGSSSGSSGASSGSSSSGSSSSGSSSGSGDGGATCSLPVPASGGLPSPFDSHCSPNNGGRGCTQTELLFLEKDTILQTGTPKNPGQVAFGCYDCLVGSGCIDDSLFATDVNHECGDTGPGGITQPTLSGDPATTSCLNVLACVLGCSCSNAIGSGTCYCGTAVGSNCNVVGGPNGACLAQEEDGLDSTTPSIINTRFTDTTYAGGMANTIMSCAASNSCTQCFP